MIEPTELNIETSRLSCLYFQDVLERHPKLSKILKQRSHELLGADFFSLLYQGQPKIKETPVDLAIATYLDLLLQEPDVEELRMQTIMDRRKSSTASIKLFQELMRSKDSVIKTLLQLQETSKQMQHNPAATEAINQLIKTQAENMSAEQSVAEAASNTSSDMQIADMLGELGMEAGKGGSQARDFEEFMNEELINSLGKQDTLRKVIRWLGKIEAALAGVKAQLPLVPPSPVDIEYGSELERVLPQELGLLGHPSLRSVFLQRYSEHQLMQTKVKERLEAEKGPFVVLIDVSGSMGSLSRALTPLVVAFALAIAVARVCIPQKRKLLIGKFASQLGELKPVSNGTELVKALFSSGERLGSGTDFDRALTGTLQQINGSPGAGDILIISDGYDTLSRLAEIRQAKGEQEVKIAGLSIGNSWDKSMLRVLDAQAECGSDYNSLSKLEWLKPLSNQIIGES
jgi:uncharacterized protein with von Willebrand factor type A (vWA) domain